MLGNDEKKYMELHSKLHEELHQLEQQIDELEERRDELTAVLDGSYEVSRFNRESVEVNEVSEPIDPRVRIDATQVDVITINGPVKRAAIDEFSRALQA